MSTSTLSLLFTKVISSASTDPFTPYVYLVDPTSGALTLLASGSQGQAGTTAFAMKIQNASAFSTAVSNAVAASASGASVAAMQSMPVVVVGFAGADNSNQAYLPLVGTFTAFNSASTVPKAFANMTPIFSIDTSNNVTLASGLNVLTMMDLGDCTGLQQDFQNATEFSNSDVTLTATIQSTGKSFVPPTRCFLVLPPATSSSDMTTLAVGSKNQWSQSGSTWTINLQKAGDGSALSDWLAGPAGGKTPQTAYLMFANASQLLFPCQVPQPAAGASPAPVTIYSDPNIALNCNISSIFDDFTMTGSWWMWLLILIAAVALVAVLIYYGYKQVKKHQDSSADKARKIQTSSQLGQGSRLGGVRRYGGLPDDDSAPALGRQDAHAAEQMPAVVPWGSPQPGHVPGHGLSQVNASYGDARKSDDGYEEGAGHMGGLRRF